MDYVVRSGQIVFEALSTTLSPQKLVGCRIDDGVSINAWTILSVNETSGAFLVCGNSITKETPFALISRGNLEVPEGDDELIKHIDGIREARAEEEKNSKKEKAERLRSYRFEQEEREKRRLDEQAEQEKVKILAQRQKNLPIAKFCDQYDFPLDEILRLIERDKEHAHLFTHMLLELREGRRATIPRVELEWAATSGAAGIVGRYTNQKLYRSVSNIEFRSTTNSASYYGSPFQVGAIHKYAKKENRSDSDMHSDQILKFKDGEQRWVSYYTKELDNIIAANTVICCAPSHNKDNWGPGLEQTIRILGGQKKRRPLPRLLRRTKDTQKRTERGSDRSKKLNRETIEVSQATAIKNEPVVIIDDVTTTGSTLEVCAELLWAAGCNCVGAIAIGRSTSPHYGYVQGTNRPSFDDLGANLDDEIPF